MSYKSSQQPFCRVCGKPIAKVSKTVYLRDAYGFRPDVNSTWSRTLDAKADTKAECQTLTNHKVLAVRLHGFLKTQGDRGRISSFSEWDGESYKDKFFCSDPCAVHMAYGAMKLYPALHFPPYETAIKKATGNT